MSLMYVRKDHFPRNVEDVYAVTLSFICNTNHIISAGVTCVESVLLFYQQEHIINNKLSSMVTI